MLVTNLTSVVCYLGITLLVQGTPSQRPQASVALDTPSRGPMKVNKQAYSSVWLHRVASYCMGRLGVYLKGMLWKIP